MKKTSKKFLILIILIISISSFLKINSLNYQKQKVIERSFVEHPENLPTKETALNTSFGFKNLKADMYWLESIQYIGSNAISADYKKYLFVMIDLITELNPYFEHPYIIGQLLIPEYNERYENLSKIEQENNVNEAIKLGLKGVKNFCDPEKIKLIKNEPDLQKVWTEEKYKNPCKEYKVPYYLAFVYHFYQKNPTNASLYYKISSANEDGLSGAKTLAAIMAGRGGEREKSYFMFLNIAKTVETDDKVCLQFASDLEQVGLEIFINKSVSLTSQILRNVGKNRDLIFGEFSEEKEEELLSDTKCGNYLNKSIRELNLEYIENADIKYKETNGYSSKNAKVLLDKGFIDYLPIDYQQYDDYGIIYEYDSDTGNYNYTLGDYNE